MLTAGRVKEHALVARRVAVAVPKQSVLEHNWVVAVGVLMRLYLLDRFLRAVVITGIITGTTTGIIIITGIISCLLSASVTLSKIRALEQELL
jgi:hypothetical protein